LHLLLLLQLRARLQQQVAQHHLQQQLLGLLAVL
jgi:hypothetical protein